MLAFIARRTLQMIPILLGITFLTFFLFNVVGWNAAYQFAGKNATAEQIKELERELGLDRPLYEQYFLYLQQIAQLDFGRSWSTKQKITTMLADGVGASLSLSVPPFFIGNILAVAIALMLAFYRNTLIDKFSLIFCLALTSISNLVYILFFQYFFAYQFNLFPISGWDSDFLARWQYVLLPAIIWIVVGLGSSVLFYRTVMLDEVFQDYVRTARAKGLDYKTVYFKHILKNAMIPIITLIILQMPFLMTGSLLLENFFSIPGLGNMMIQALLNSDLPVIKAMTFLGAVLYMVFNLISDICYSLVDPRIRIG